MNTVPPSPKNIKVLVPCSHCGTAFKCAQWRIDGYLNNYCSKVCESAHRRFRDLRPVEQRFDEKVLVVESGCWEWQGCLTRAGYGQITIQRKRVYTHRWSYERHKGPIPEGLTIDTCAGIASA